ncbi:hypothetical protein BCR32DRAFT_324843 [Anaeromyces robustus]|uniref:Glycosyltransferase family 1 protein n=1 Tax=Anaeromyces robustus TaxID=1754192 RepID=A0A1Y1XM50_9FUNG|nr:hypothetical protein BCR32DRAFT_324843 [Anaeromyces robustus]|eukprot:ORX86775.1 hypothetical protein BCR32DRAFT_324843 [Anaeromyces robustus]
MMIGLINYNFVLIYNSDKYKHIIKKIKRDTVFVEIDISPSTSSRIGGPFALNRSLRDVLPYHSPKGCRFIPSDVINPSNTKNKTIDYFYITLGILDENVYNEWVKINKTSQLLLGPNFVPSNWWNFPNQGIWREKKFPEILKSLKSVVVQSDRVRDHLAGKSNTTSLLDKYVTVRPCTNERPKIENLKSFNDRTIDILYFEKYADLDRKKQGAELYDLLSNSKKKIARMTYGNYTRDQMKEWASDSKFIIYFSFYDTGAAGLKEIQNYGVLTFTLQKEFITDENIGFLIPELDTEDKIKIAYEKIMEKVDAIAKENPDTKSIAKINQDYNMCEKTLDDLCKGILRS